MSYHSQERNVGNEERLLDSYNRGLYTSYNRMSLATGNVGHANDGYAFGYGAQ